MMRIRLLFRRLREFCLLTNLRGLDFTKVFLPSGKVMHNYARLLPLYVVVLLAATDAGNSKSACGQPIEIERSGLLYGIGRVDRVARDPALIDLGDVHSLRVGEKVALIRPTDDYYEPIGVVEIAETYPTYSRAARSTRIEPQAGDIVLFGAMAILIIDSFTSL